MKKIFIKSLLVSLLALAVVGNAYAIPHGNYLVNADYWALNEYSNGQGTFEMYFEVPEFIAGDGGISLESSEYAFGIYTGAGLSYEIFNYTDEPGYSIQSVFFQEIGNQWYISDSANGIFTIFDNQFGFYVQKYEADLQNGYIAGQVYYTEAALNDDLLDHIFVGMYPDYTRIWFDENLDDVMEYKVATDDIAPVPEPASLLLLGTGLLSISGLAIRRRKNTHQIA